MFSTDRKFSFIKDKKKKKKRLKIKQLQFTVSHFTTH